jgi:hypothetical protein
MVWEGLDAVKTGRAMLGATNPLASAPGTIRGDYALQVSSRPQGRRSNLPGHAADPRPAPTSATAPTLSRTARRRSPSGSPRALPSTSSRRPTGSTRRNCIPSGRSIFGRCSIA